MRVHFFDRQWKARPGACIGAGILIGMVICDRLVHFPLWLLLPAVILLTAGIAMSVKKARLAFVPFLCACILIGGIRLTAVTGTYAPVEDIRGADIIGTVVSDPSFNKAGDRIVCNLRIEEINGLPNTPTVKLYIRSDSLPLEGILYGQKIRFTGSVWAQSSATNPNQFDSRKWLLSDGLCGMASAKLEDITVLYTFSNPNTFVYRIRHVISETIDLLFPKNAAIVKAFVLGVKNEIDSDLKDDFSKVGVAHLICISGMHISVLAMFIAAVLKRFLSRNASIFTTLGIVLLYGYLIGFPVSLVRATVMFAILSSAPLFGRTSDPFTRLFVALGGMLLIQPLNLYRTGFALSFSASAGILFLDAPLEHLTGIARLKNVKLRKKKMIVQFGIRSILYVGQLMCASLAAQLGTLPFVIQAYGSQSPLTLAVNLVAVPLAMIAYPIALLAVLVSAVWYTAAYPLAFISDHVFTLLVQFVKWVASFPIQGVHIPVFPMYLCLLYFACICIASPLCRFSERVRGMLCGTTVLCVLASIAIAYISSLGCHLLFFDAGEADSSLIIADGHCVLIDAGEEYTPAADYISANCLRLDAIFLSHPHSDHAGGLSEILDVMRPNAIYVTDGWFNTEESKEPLISEGIEKAKSYGVPILEVRTNDTIRFSDGLTAEVRSTRAGSSDINDMSMVLQVDYRGTRVLYTADLPSTSEPDDIDDIDILKVAHHGSAASTSARFLSKTTPEIAVISVGDNSYGHPSEEVLERLHEIGALVLRTDECGMIRIDVDKDRTCHVNTFMKGTN